jgi:hypothetical protein
MFLGCASDFAVFSEKQWAFTALSKSSAHHLHETWIGDQRTVEGTKFSTLFRHYVFNVIPSEVF